MPLPPPAERELLHNRHYEMQGFQRSDGLWDIEGRITDSKTYAFKNEFRGTIQAHEPLHEMWIRVTIDDNFVVQDIAAETLNGPFEVCPAIAPNIKKMTGERIGPGWRKAIRQQLGGVEGCTHISELLGAMATVAYQTLSPILAKRARHDRQEDNASRRKPRLLDSCHAFASDGEIARKSWPEFYTGPDKRE